MPFQKNRIYDATCYAYSLSVDDIAKCVNFKNSLPWDVQGRNYGNYNNEYEFRQNHYIGKAAEFACYQMLSKEFNNIIEPDVSIYPGGQLADHDADITVGKNKVSIKVCPGNGQLSWLFNINDVAKNNKTVICCQIVKGVVSIRACMDHKFIRDKNLLKKPRREIKNKMAIYFSDLVELFPTLVGRDAA